MPRVGPRGWSRRWFKGRVFGQVRKGPEAGSLGGVWCRGGVREGSFVLHPQRADSPPRPPGSPREPVNRFELDFSGPSTERDQSVLM